MSSTGKKRVNIYLSKDMAERLKQYAWENHTSVSHAIIEWICIQKSKMTRYAAS